MNIFPFNNPFLVNRNKLQEAFFFFPLVLFTRVRPIPRRSGSRAALGTASQALAIGHDTHTGRVSAQARLLHSKDVPGLQRTLLIDKQCLGAPAEGLFSQRAVSNQGLLIAKSPRCPAFCECYGESEMERANGAVKEKGQADHL